MDVNVIGESILIVNRKYNNKDKLILSFVVNTIYVT